MGEWEAEDVEHDNVRAALAWAREARDVDLELQLVGSAGRFYWPNRGLLTEGRRWLDEALARSEGADERRRAVAKLAAAHHARRQGDPDGCDQLAAEAQAVFERLDDPPSLGSALMARAIAAEWRADLKAEVEYYETAERIFRELGNSEPLDSIRSNRAYAEIIVGNFESAERRLRELAGLATGQARLFALINHGLALARLGQLEEAHVLCRRPPGSWFRRPLHGDQVLCARGSRDSRREARERPTRRAALGSVCRDPGSERLRARDG